MLVNINGLFLLSVSSAEPWPLSGAPAPRGDLIKGLEQQARAKDGAVPGCPHNGRVRRLKPGVSCSESCPQGFSCFCRFWS